MQSIFELPYKPVFMYISFWCADLFTILSINSCMFQLCASSTMGDGFFLPYARSLLLEIFLTAFKHSYVKKSPKRAIKCASSYEFRKKKNGTTDFNAEIERSLHIYVRMCNVYIPRCSV